MKNLYFRIKKMIPLTCRVVWIFVKCKCPNSYSVRSSTIAGEMLIDVIRRWYVPIFWIGSILVVLTVCFTQGVLASKVINRFVFHLPSNKAKICLLLDTVPIRWPNFGFEICLWNTNCWITLELIEISWWNFLWLMTTIMVNGGMMMKWWVWQHH